jgi:NAD(P)-dependent dehydrogenase (short-subunit alcohol dehydrogenase family)
MSTSSKPITERDVVVVIGTGGLGIAAARRIGAGRHIVLADPAAARLALAVGTLTSSGHEFTTCQTDASDPAAVQALVDEAVRHGPIRTIIHTAGISPTQGTVAEILRVNLFGTALVLDAFLPVAQRGTVIVCIASQGGYRLAVTPETERLLAHTPTDRLLALSALNPATLTESEAYSLSKRGVHARVARHSIDWASRGARAVTVSPGMTATPQSLHELTGPHGDVIRNVMARSGSRMGTPDDIAAVVEFLTSSAASFINGSDFLVDGGAIAYQRFGDPAGPGEYFFDREPI